MGFLKSEHGKIVANCLIGSLMIAAAYILLFFVIISALDISVEENYFLWAFIATFLWLSSLAIMFSEQLGLLGGIDELLGHLIVLFLAGWVVIIPIVIFEQLVSTSSVFAGMALIVTVMGVKFRTYLLHAPKPRPPLDRLIGDEKRENVRDALIRSKQTVEEIGKNIEQLSAKKGEMEEGMANQKKPYQIEMTLEKYQQRLQQAKGIDSMSTARTYAFMIIKQKRKLEMTERLGTAIEKVSAKIQVLTHLREDILETAYELPGEAELVGSMSAINAAMDEVHNVDAIMGEVATIEDELKGLAVETGIAAEEDAVDIESLPADVREEIERELEG